jgi:hypothetical protein
VVNWWRKRKSVKMIGGSGYGIKVQKVSKSKRKLKKEDKQGLKSKQSNINNLINSIYKKTPTVRYDDTMQKIKILKQIKNNIIPSIEKNKYLTKEQKIELINNIYSKLNNENLQKYIHASVNNINKLKTDIETDIINKQPKAIELKKTIASIFKNIRHNGKTHLLKESLKKYIVPGIIKNNTISIEDKSTLMKFLREGLTDKYDYELQARIKKILEVQTLEQDVEKLKKAIFYEIEKDIIPKIRYERIRSNLSNKSIDTKRENLIKLINKELFKKDPNEIKEFIEYAKINTIEDIKKKFFPEIKEENFLKKNTLQFNTKKRESLPKISESDLKNIVNNLNKKLIINQFHNNKVFGRDKLEITKKWMNSEMIPHILKNAKFTIENKYELMKFIDKGLLDQSVSKIRQFEYEIRTNPTIIQDVNKFKKKIFPNIEKYIIPEINKNVKIETNKKKMLLDLIEKELFNKEPEEIKGFEIFMNSTQFYDAEKDVKEIIRKFFPEMEKNIFPANKKTNYSSGTMKTNSTSRTVYLTGNPNNNISF